MLPPNASLIYLILAVISNRRAGKASLGRDVIDLKRLFSPEKQTLMLL
jgi:hypothetical protein